MSNLKSRVAKLENIANPKKYGGIIIYTANRVTKKDEKGFDVTMSQDCYLQNSDEGDPLTDTELEKALEGKTYICYMPVQDKRPEYIEVTSK